MTTVLYLAGPVLLGGGFVYGAIRHLFRPWSQQPKQPDERPFDEVEARMDLAIANETHDGRRMGLRLARHNHPEQP